MIVLERSESLPAVSSSDSSDTSPAVSLVGRAVAEGNRHPSDRVRQFKPVRRSLAAGVLKARAANRTLVQCALGRSGGLVGGAPLPLGASSSLSSLTSGGMAAAASREACTTTLPFAAIVDRHSGSRGLGSGAYLAGVLRNLSMYSSGQGGGRPRLGERAADGSHEGTWNLGAAPAPRFGAASSTSFSSSAARAVIEGDDIGSF